MSPDSLQEREPADFSPGWTSDRPYPTPGFMTYPERIIPFDGLTNFRDFGGYRAGTGRLATGRLFRSASHALATEKDLERLAGMGITTVVDLRRPSERERQPSRRWSGFQGMVVENDDHSEGSRAWDTFMSQWDFSQEAYRSFLLGYYAEAPHLPRLVDLFGRYFDRLAHGEGAIVVHCAAGKDRTGLAVALTHILTGVHRDDVIADYLLTNVSGRFETHGASWQELIRQQRGSAPDLETMRFIMGVEAEYLERSLTAITERNGDIERYMREALGVDSAKRALIEDRLLG